VFGILDAGMDPTNPPDPAVTMLDVVKKVDAISTPPEITETR
jgi:hypothetical protein